MRATVPPSVLREFVVLAQASDEEVAKFAGRFGPLGLCEQHGLPVHHNWATLGEHRLHGCGPGRRERVDAWRAFALEARLLREFAEAFGRGDDTPEQLLDLAQQVGMREVFDARSARDWVTELGIAPGIDTSDEEVERQTAQQQNVEREVIASMLLRWVADRWLTFGEVRIRYRWDHERATASPFLEAPGLFGLLATKLLADIVRLMEGKGDARSLNAVECAGCGRVFVPKAKPRPGQRSWCDDPECKKAARTAADRARRERERASKQQVSGVTSRQTGERRRRKNGN